MKKFINSLLPSSNKYLNYKIFDGNVINIEFLQQIINNLDECIIVLDHNKEVLLMNTSFLNKLKISGIKFPYQHQCTELFKKHNFTCENNTNYCPYDEVFLTLKAVKTIHEYEIDGEIRYVEILVSPLYDQNKKIIAYLESRRNITEHVKLNQQLKNKEHDLYDLAHQDILTGIPNRRLFLSELEKAILVAQKKSKLMAVLFIDLDNFKQINDTLGHQIGDEVLKVSAKRLQGLIREKDLICRLGGDEFVILLNALKEPEHAALLAQKIIEKQSKKIKIEKYELFMKSSIGISLYPNNGATAEELLQHADIAMYKSKQLGRNTFSYYTQELTDKSLNKMLLEKDLYQAIAKKQLIIYYQPQVNLESGQLTGMEAMIRWDHPQKGLLSPEKFIPIAEQSSLIEDIGQWTLETVCKQIVNWQQAGNNPGRIAVNLAGRQLLNEGLINKIHQVLDQTHCTADCLEFKITEGFIPHLTDKAIKTLNILRDMGVELSIDDFGKGYASLAFLKRLPITRLKIDRSFIQANDNVEANEDIARAIIALGKSLHLKVIAEGVEQQDQQNLLSRVGCKEAQGYLFGHPMDCNDMSNFLIETEGKK